jgi:deoxyribonuclease-1-like protein
MFKLLRTALLVGIGFGIWYFFTHFRVSGLENLKVQPRAGGSTAEASTSLAPSIPAPQPGKKTIRIAAANFGPLDQAKLAKQPVVGRLVQILRQFDLVALQDIQARDRNLLVQLLEQTNAGGRHYDFAVAPEVGREPSIRQYNAFVFDEETIEIDRRTVAWVDNRAGQFTHPPLVGAFRARGPAPREAFTFTLINVQTSSERTAMELALLAGVFRAVRDDGRNEDDVILLGTLGTDEEHLGSLALLPNACAAISAVPTTTHGIRAVDNILFDRRATSEYVHRSGVLDLVRQFNLSTREAAEITEHLPVWAEFSVYEGGQAGQVPAN